MKTTTANTPRIVSGIAAFVLLGTALTGCAFIPSFPGAASGDGEQTESELAGTTWTGVDSDGDSWGLELESDGTVGLTYNGEQYDDSGDVWAQAGDTVTFHLGFDDGDIDMIGQYEGLDAPMEATGTYDGGTFTITLTNE